MLTADGCRARRERLWQRPEIPADVSVLALADPIHLGYFADAYSDPINLGHPMPMVLLVRRDGSATLISDRRAPASVCAAHVEDKVMTDWYDGQSPGAGPRQLAIDGQLAKLGVARIHDRFGDPLHVPLTKAIAAMRRAKDADEIAAQRVCMRACEAGHAWARANLKAGMSELDVYGGVSAACVKAAGQPAIVYGDFAVSPGPERKGGPATAQVLRDGDMFILDYSVVIGGYRSDFTNTLVVGGKPNDAQRRLYDSCMAAMKAGEGKLRAGMSCLAVYNAVADAFGDSAAHFPHHAGHGLGLSHPEAPYFVRKATETLVAGDVVTLEPGLYVAGVGGIRIEHNYLVTEDGFERLSNHVIALA
ncbi:MAG: Xaa-Pro peptidase family protein [Gemmataceae bacterium]